MANPKESKQQESQQVAQEELLFLDTSEIDTSFENIRTGDFTQGSSKEDGSGQDFAELVESIKTRGQKVPVTVRRHGKKYQLVAGFRRYTAIKAIEADSGEKLKVKAILKTLDDLGAVVENAIENHRQGLRGADLMMGLDRIYRMSLAQGTDLSVRALAGLVGVNHQHAADLMNIKRKCPEVADLWHKATYQLGIREMRSITKIEDKKLQLETYHKLLNDRMPTDEDGETDGTASPDVWVDRAIKQVERVAFILGRLEQRGCVKQRSMIWVEELETLGAKIKKDAKKKQLNRIARAAEKKWQEGIDYVEPTAESDEESEEDAA